MKEPEEGRVVITDLKLSEQRAETVAFALVKVVARVAGKRWHDLRLLDLAPNDTAAEIAASQREWGETFSLVARRLGYSDAAVRASLQAGKVDLTIDFA